MNGKIWIVAADATFARVFSTENSHSPLEELNDLAHLASRSNASGLVSDRPGRGNATGHSGSHSVGHEKDVKDQEALIFAREISAALEKARNQKQFNRLYLLASSQMLGLLRKQISQETQSLISKEFDINVVKEAPDHIRQHLPEHL